MEKTQTFDSAGFAVQTKMLGKPGQRSRRVHMRVGAVALIASFIAVLASIETVHSADRILLRSLKAISGRTVTSFDEDGAKLDDGSIVTWDNIEKATVDASKQEAFDKLLKELGEPLYRIRLRLKNADYEGLLKPAESVYSRYVGRRSPTAYMVFQALMWARMEHGQREAALEPYFYAYEYLKQTRAGDDSLPGERRLNFDPATALASKLQPVWFDSQAAKAAVPRVLQAIRSMQRPQPSGVYIYYATLAAAAGDEKTAKNVLGFAKDMGGVIAEWREIAEAQLEIASGEHGEAVSRLATKVDRLDKTRPAALYWLGMSKLASNVQRVRQEGVLRLLHVPALYGRQHPELAGAALYQSMTAMDKTDVKGSIAIRRELLERYAHTVYGAKLKSESAVKK